MKKTIESLIQLPGENHTSFPPLVSQRLICANLRSSADYRLNRREFIKTTGIIAGGLIWQSKTFAEQVPVTINDVRIAKGVAIGADGGTIGMFAGSSSQDLKTL